MLSKKVYIEIAKILAENATKKQKFFTKDEELGWNTCWSNIALDLGRYFKEDNSRFDPERFRKAIYS